MMPAAANDDPSVIRDAACVVLVDAASAPPRLLMGRRHADQIFLPDKWVFPGGRLDQADHVARSGGPVAGLPAWLHPFARAAVRELQEETGLRWPSGSSNDEGLQPLARAITPPGRVRRYDTWFFLTRISAAAADRFEGDGELLDLGWFTIDEARRLDVPNITRLVLDDATWTLAAPQNSRPETAPFYFQSANGYERAWIDCRAASTPP